VASNVNFCPHFVHSAVHRPRFRNDIQSVIECRIRKNRVTVIIDDDQVIDWHGDLADWSLGLNEKLDRRRLWLAVQSPSVFRIDRVELRPL
jgi:hypothetical protein